MIPLRARSFEGRIFLSVLLVVLVPAGGAVTLGVLTLQGIGTRSGTLGAWDSVAESGRTLIEALDEAGVEDPAVRAAAETHRDALSESVRLSRLYAFVTERFLSLLPAAALLTGLLVTGLALVTARRLSRGFGRPIVELAGWTERIAREESLPAPGPEERDELAEVATLRQALRTMADELAAGRKRAVETARLRSWTRLARSVAHELKNPLTPMRMAAATLARGRSGAEAEAVAVLQEEIDRLDEMARTFSRYGRVPEGPSSRVALRELLQGLARQHGSAAVPVRVTGPEVEVEAHHGALERAVRNLVVNAVEAQDGAAARGVGAVADPGETPRKGGQAAAHEEERADRPGVELSVARDGDDAVIRVADRGSGIPPELLDEIWNPDVTTKRRGTGLGLALVRQAVEHHGGTVAAANRSGGGAVFTLRLPAGGAGGNDPPPADSS
jgi:signal transduction histidine kinase